MNSKNLFKISIMKSMLFKKAIFNSTRSDKHHHCHITVSAYHLPIHLDKKCKNMIMLPFMIAYYLHWNVILKHLFLSKSCFYEESMIITCTVDDSIFHIKIKMQVLFIFLTFNIHQIFSVLRFMQYQSTENKLKVKWTMLKWV